MSRPITSLSRAILLFIVFLIGCAGLVQQASRTSAHSTVGAPLPTVVGPLRLRLKVKPSTVSEEKTIDIWADFLDGNYNPIPNDSTRAVKFEIAGPRGATGSISPAQPVTVKPGETSAFAKFTPGQPGRVLIRASSEGLDSDETFVLVTPKRPVSLLTQILGMFETVAYAQPPGAFEFLRQSVKVTAGRRAKFQVDLSSLPVGSKVTFSTDPAATIVYEDKATDDDMDITLGEAGGESTIFVSSPDPGIVKVFAEARSSGLKASALAEFTEPKPHRICLIDEALTSLPVGSSPCLTKLDIPSTVTEYPITIQLADEAGNLIKSDASRKITFRPGNSDDPVKFDPPSLDFSQNQGSAAAWIHFTRPLWENELMVMAGGSADQPLIPLKTSLFIRSPIEGVTITGPSEVKRGSTDAEFIVGLVDKDGYARRADVDRKINLSVTGGRLSQPEVTIFKNQDSTKVQYFPAFAGGKVVLKAESFGLTKATTGIVLITPLSWLILAALCGGAIGGVARHLPKGETLGHYLTTYEPSWKTVAGSITGSLISGLIFYLAMKLGFSGALGFTLPPSFDVATGIAAFFLASVGGYMGVGRVFDGLANLWGQLFAKKDGSAGTVSG